MERGTWLHRGSYGVFVAITGSMWMLPDAHGNLPVSATYNPVTTHRSRNCHEVVTSHSTVTPSRKAVPQEPRQAIFAKWSGDMATSW